MNKKTGDWFIDPIEWSNLVKEICVSCNLPIKKEAYEENGNYCLKCCLKVSAAARQRERKRGGVDNFRQMLNSMLDSSHA